MSFKRYGIEDLAYLSNFNQMIETLREGYNFEKCNFDDVCDFLEILEFYDDKSSLPFEYQEKLEKLKAKIKDVAKYIGKYFGNYNSVILADDFAQLKKGHYNHYFLPLL